MGEEASPFARGPNERPLRLILDRETLSDDKTLRVILALAKRDTLEVVSTREDESTLLIQIDPIDRPRDMAPVRFLREGQLVRYTGVSVVSKYERLARNFAEAGVASEPDALRALFLCDAAERFAADGLLTASPVLLTDHALRRFIPRGNPMSSAAGAALAGLFLRCRRDFQFPSSHGPVGISPWTFYDFTAREHYDRLVAAVVQNGSGVL